MNDQPFTNILTNPIKQITYIKLFYVKEKLIFTSEMKIYEGLKPYF